METKSELTDFEKKRIKEIIDSQGVKHLKPEEMKEMKEKFSNLSEEERNDIWDDLKETGAQQGRNLLYRATAEGLMREEEYLHFETKYGMDYIDWATFLETYYSYEKMQDGNDPVAIVTVPDSGLRKARDELKERFPEKEILILTPEEVLKEVDKIKNGDRKKG